MSSIASEYPFWIGGEASKILFAGQRIRNEKSHYFFYYFEELQCFEIQPPASTCNPLTMKSSEITCLLSSLSRGHQRKGYFHFPAWAARRSVRDARIYADESVVGLPSKKNTDCPVLPSATSTDIQWGVHQNKYSPHACTAAAPHPSNLT